MRFSIFCRGIKWYQIKISLELEKEIESSKVYWFQRFCHTRQIFDTQKS